MENVIIFGADIRSSVHVDTKGRNILILGEGSIQGLDDTTFTAEAKFTINFPVKKKISVKPTLYWKQQFLVCYCYKTTSVQSNKRLINKRLCTVFR